MDQDERTRVQKLSLAKGYGAFSIGQSNVADLRPYVGGQKQHHRRVTFEEEYRGSSSVTRLNSTSTMFGIDTNSAPSALLVFPDFHLGRWPRLSHLAPLARAGSLIVNRVVCLAMSFAGLLLPQYEDLVSNRLPRPTRRVRVHAVARGEGG